MESGPTGFLWCIGGGKATDLGCDRRVSVGRFIRGHSSSCSWDGVLVSQPNTLALRPITCSSQSLLNHKVQLTRLVVHSCPNLVASFPLILAMTEISVLFQPLSVVIQRFNAILFLDSFVKEEEE